MINISDGRAISVKRRLMKFSKNCTEPSKGGIGSFSQTSFTNRIS